MSDKKTSEATSKNTELSRRRLLGDGAGVAAAGIALPSLSGLDAGVHSGRETIKVGLIGCGGRGTGAARDCVRSSEGVEIHALADLVPDRLNSCRERLKKAVGDSLKVSD